MKKKKAFTLAEVLITLGIIGIIAAMTLPTLVAKYKKLVIETSLKKTYSELQNLVKISEAANGDWHEWDGSKPITRYVEQYFAPYIHLTRCNSKHQCFIPIPRSPFFGWYNPTATAQPGDLQETNSEFVTYNLNDGRSIMFQKEYHPDLNYVTLNIIVDVNGKRGRTVMGQDVFVFSLCNFRGITDRLKVGPGASWSENFTTERLTTDCIKNLPYVLFKGSACIHLLERNNWKFPKDYPIKF